MALIPGADYGVAKLSVVQAPAVLRLQPRVIREPRDCQLEVFVCGISLCCCPPYLACPVVRGANQWLKGGLRIFWDLGDPAPLPRKPEALHDGNEVAVEPLLLCLSFAALLDHVGMAFVFY